MVEFSIQRQSTRAGATFFRHVHFRTSGVISLVVFASVWVSASVCIRRCPSQSLRAQTAVSGAPHRSDHAEQTRLFIEVIMQSSQRLACVVSKLVAIRSRRRRPHRMAWLRRLCKGPELWRLEFLASAKLDVHRQQELHRIGLPDAGRRGSGPPYAECLGR